MPLSQSGGVTLSFSICLFMYLIEMRVNKITKRNAKAMNTNMFVRTNFSNEIAIMAPPVIEVNSGKAFK